MYSTRPTSHGMDAHSGSILDYLQEIGQCFTFGLKWLYRPIWPVKQRPVKFYFKLSFLYSKIAQLLDIIAMIIIIPKMLI